MSLSVKLNILIVSIILAVSCGLLLIGYNLYCRKVDELCFARAERAGRVTVSIPGSEVAWLWKQINSEEFRQVRSDAIAANDEKIIEDWLRNQKGAYYEGYTKEELENPDNAEYASL